ncbi:MAG: flippase-like domain-containing protein [bacterium]|nr:flippase-like domain-containing protein [bacterium]
MKRPVKTVIKIIISTVLIWFIVSKYGVSTFVTLFRDVEYSWILFGILLMSLSNVLGAFQWSIILRNLEVDLPFRKALGFFYTGLFFNNFLLSFIGGDALRIYDISKSSGKNSHAVSTVFLDRFIGLLTLTVFAVIAAVLSMGMVDLSNVLLIIAGIFAVILFVLFFLYSKPFAKKFESFGKKIIPKRFHSLISDIYNSYSYYRTHPVLISKILIISVFVQSLRIIVHYFMARSIGVEISLVYFFLFIPVITIIILLPIVPGGIGLREFSAVALFQFVGVAGEKAAVFENMAFVVAIICSLPGIFTFILKRHEAKNEIKNA